VQLHGGMEKKKKKKSVPWQREFRAHSGLFVSFVSRRTRGGYLERSQDKHQSGYHETGQCAESPSNSDGFLSRLRRDPPGSKTVQFRQRLGCPPPARVRHAIMPRSEWIKLQRHLGMGWDRNWPSLHLGDHGGSEDALSHSS
jgi:hypothetical protein